MTKILPFQTKNRDAPTNILLKLPDRNRKSKARSRKYLLPDEVEALMKAAGSVGRHRLRDKTLVLVMFRHGLRVSEAIDLRWDQVDFKGANLRVNRLKSGNPATSSPPSGRIAFLEASEAATGHSLGLLIRKNGPVD